TGGRCGGEEGWIWGFPCYLKKKRQSPLQYQKGRDSRESRHRCRPRSPTLRVVSWYQPCLTYFLVQAEDGIRVWSVTGVQTCALPICHGEAGLDPVARESLEEERGTEKRRD